MGRGPNKSFEEKMAELDAQKAQLLVKENRKRLAEHPDVKAAEERIADKQAEIVKIQNLQRNAEERIEKYSLKLAEAEEAASNGPELEKGLKAEKKALMRERDALIQQLTEQAEQG